MKQEVLSPRERVMNDSVIRMERLIDDLIDLIYDVQDSLYAAFDFHKPAMRPILIAEIELRVNPIQENLKKAHSQLKRSFGVD